MFVSRAFKSILNLDQVSWFEVARRTIAPQFVIFRRRSSRCWRDPKHEPHQLDATLTNFHTCLCGGVTTDYFGIAPPTLQEYERLVLAHVSGTTCIGVRRAHLFIEMLTFSLQLYKKTWPRVCNHPQDTHNLITNLDKSIDIQVLTSCTSRCTWNGSRKSAVAFGMAAENLQLHLEWQ